MLRERVTSKGGTTEAALRTMAEQGVKEGIVAGVKAAEARGRELGKLLRVNCREGDVALRIGGEEFAVLLNGVSAERAVAAAERFRSGVLAKAWSELAPGLSVTASFGVAMVAEAPTKFGLLALADRRMYEAKVGGRNRVVGPA